MCDTSRHDQSTVLRTKIRLHPLSIQSAPKKECGYQTQANEMRADLSRFAFWPYRSDKADSFDIRMVAYSVNCRDRTVHDIQHAIERAYSNAPSESS